MDSFFRQVPRSISVKHFKRNVHKNIYLVQSACEIDDDFPGSVIINDLKLTNVTCVVEQGD